MKELIHQMLYVSTSRKPTQQTRTLAKWLARLFGGEYENRGKRSVVEIASRMQEKGFSRAVFVYEKHGSPYSLNFLDVEGGWLYPEVLLGGFQVLKGENERVGAVAQAEAQDPQGEKILELSGFESGRGKGIGLKMVLSSKGVSFNDERGNAVFYVKINGFKERAGKVEG
ncbi:MAG: hypothetical protein QXR53_03035 [Candidatus Norongarragalinales archaeon]